eukprot:GHVO01018108.1.p1 GENE.GHVO01018108.1~~GHVO01018108.1.p1  ORF type:complete len:298 (+),score=40.20 GHVO01018108.1:29-922(+)
MGYVDINIPWNKKHAPLLIQAMIQHRYKGCAFTVQVDSFDVGDEVDCDIDEVEISPLCLQMLKSNKAPPRNELDMYVQSNHRFMQARRLTICYSHENSVNVGKISRLNKYWDILSVQPEDDKAWTQAVENLDVDLISIDFSKTRIPFNLRRKQLGVAANRGVFFEIIIGDFRQSPESRSSFLANIQPLISYLPKNRIILSSGARTPLDVCNPIEIANLASVLGFGGHNQCLEFLRKNAIALLYKGSSRRACSGMIGMSRSMPFSTDWGEEKRKKRCLDVDDQHQTEPKKMKRSNPLV